MADTSFIVQAGTLLALVIGFIAQWFREGRAQKWAEASAKLIADKATAAAEAVALRASNEVLAQAAEGNKIAATLAAKVLTDAKEVADKVLTAAKELAGTVAQNTEISTSAASEAKVAYTEANSQNAKIIALGALIAELTKQVVSIAEHIKTADAKNIEDERLKHEELMFHQRLKQAIDEKLTEMNGHTEHLVDTRKKVKR